MGLVMMKNDYIRTCFKKYATFKGRATRSEFWYFLLFNFIVQFLIGFVDAMTGMAYTVIGNIISNLYALAIIIPSISVAVRRMHDVNKSGWFILIPIYNFILAVTASHKEKNEYGELPRS